MEGKCHLCLVGMGWSSSSLMKIKTFHNLGETGSKLKLTDF
jgi:hypothetical protein